MEQSHPDDFRMGEDTSDDVCPTCGEQFASARGVKIHHKAAHGESIKPSVTCEWCNNEFQVKPRRLDTAQFCYSECQTAYQNKHHRTTLVCETCNEEFDVVAAKAETSRFCSRECLGEQRANDFRGSDNPQWSGGPVTVTCDGCGEEYRVRQAKADSSRFCSLDCKGDVYARERRAENNPGWEGGFSDLAKTLRNITGETSWDRIRDREQADECTMCGVSEGASDGRALHVHHIVPVLAGGTSEPWNLVCLCASCHRRAEVYTKEIVDLYLAPDLLNSSE